MGITPQRESDLPCADRLVDWIGSDACRPAETHERQAIAATNGCKLSIFIRLPPLTGASAHASALTGISCELQSALSQAEPGETDYLTVVSGGGANRCM